MQTLIKKCLVLFISLCLASCAGMSNRQGATCDLKLIRSFTKTKIGTGVGSAIGAGAGAAIGGEKHRLEGALAGAVVGAFLGAGVGYLLDAQDECDLQAKMIEALNTAPINQPVHWQSNRSNASAEITVIGKSEEFRQVSIPLKSANGPLVASTSLSIRSGPDTTYDVIKKLKPGSEVSALGRTESGWYKVEKDGIIGYAKQDYLRPKSSIASRKPHKIRHKETVRTKNTYIANKETAYKETGQTGTASTEDRVVQPNQASEKIMINMKVKCKITLIKQKNENLTGKSCQTPDGTWGA